MHENVSAILITSCIILLALGIMTLVAGIIVLVSKVFSRDVQDISAEIKKLAQKGIGEEISGVLGNASYLIKELNLLIMTSRGIGLSLVIIGGLLLLGVLVLLFSIL